MPCRMSLSLGKLRSESYGCPAVSVSHSQQHGRNQRGWRCVRQSVPSSGNTVAEAVGEGPSVPPPQQHFRCKPILKTEENTAATSSVHTATEQNSKAH